MTSALDGKLPEVACRIFIGTEGSPGVVTAVVLFLPIGIAEFFEAAREGVLSDAVAVGALVTGAILMAFPIVMLKTKSLPYFRQG